MTTASSARIGASPRRSRATMTRSTVIGVGAALYAGCAVVAAVALALAPAVRVHGLELGGMVPLAVVSWAVVATLLVAVAAREGPVGRTTARRDR